MLAGFYNQKHRKELDKNGLKQEANKGRKLS